MMSIKKRIWLMILFYVWNVGFSLLCIEIASRGYWATLRYEWVNCMQLAAMLLLVSFWEMCEVMHRYHRKRNAFGKECIPLDYRETLQGVGLGLFYSLSFICAFRTSASEVCMWLYLFAVIYVVVMFVCGAARFLWIEGDERYVVTEIGEVYPLKTVERSREACMVSYLNDKKKEKKIRVKRRESIKSLWEDGIV